MEDKKITFEVSIKNALNIIGGITTAQLSRGALSPELSSLSQDLTTQLFSQATEVEINNYSLKS